MNFDIQLMFRWIIFASITTKVMNSYLTNWHAFFSVEKAYIWIEIYQNILRTFLLLCEWLCHWECIHVVYELRHYCSLIYTFTDWKKKRKKNKTFYLVRVGNGKYCKRRARMSDNDFFTFISIISCFFFSFKFKVHFCFRTVSCWLWAVFRCFIWNWH